MVALVAAAVASAGCGGDDGSAEALSASAFKAKANQICQDTAKANESALKGIDRDDASALAAATQDVAERTQSALDDLDDLEGPESAEAAVDRFLDAADRFADAARKQSEALAGNDSAAAKAAQDELARLNVAAQQAARDAGLDVCAS